MKLYNRLLQSKTAAKIVAAAYRFLAGFTVISRLTLLPRLTRKRTKSVAEENYLNNSSLESGSRSTSGRIINDQGGATGKSFRFGFHPARYNACEAIAIHNALVLLGKGSAELTLSSVIYDVQKSGGMLRMGEWGTSPRLLGSVLKRKYGIKTSAVLNPNKPLKDGVYIISYWNSPIRLGSGVHTVAVLSEKGELRVFNDDFCSLSEKRFKGRLLPQKYRAGFIIGYQCRG